MSLIWLWEGNEHKAGLLACLREGQEWGKELDGAPRWACWQAESAPGKLSEEPCKTRHAGFEIR